MASAGLIHLLKSNPVAFSLSVGLHLVFFIILGINFSNNEIPVQKTAPKKTVKAVVLDSEVVASEIKKLKQADLKRRQDELKRKNQIKKAENRLKKKIEKEKKRLAEIKKKQKQLKKEQDLLKRKNVEQKLAIAKEKKAAEEQAAKRVEAERVAAANKKKAAALAEKKKQDEIAAAKRRAAAEKELRLKLQEEERLLAKHNVKLQALRSQYVKLIEQKVERNWLRPTSWDANSKCEVFVTQSILGDVIKVRFGACSKNQVFRSSIERAVRKSSPLPPPPSSEVFDREIRFIFKPK